jgi:hypothetical protein
MDVFNAPSSTKEFRMQSTGSTFAPSVTIQRLAEALGAVPDPRRVASTSYTLAAMLALAVSAILANHRSVLAIAEFGARQSAEQLQALGFPNGRTPCQSTLQRLFRQLDGLALAQVLTQWITPQAVPAAETRQGVAVDGKAQRGRLRFPGAGGTVHALSAFCHTSGLVLAHEPIVATADKTEAELSVAPTLLARIDWTAAAITCSWSRRTSRPCTRRSTCTSIPHPRSRAVPSSTSAPPGRSMSGMVAAPKSASSSQPLI